MDISLTRYGEQSAREMDALGVLNSAVYPPDVVANWPGRTIEWSRRQWSVVVWNDDHTQALCHAGLVIRQGRYHGEHLRIGGIGGVMTHPAHRQQRLATAAIARCLEFFQEQADIDIGLLVCTPELMAFYARLGWQELIGDLVVQQQGHAERFTFNRTMTFPLRRQEPLSGTIDLLGPPW